MIPYLANIARILTAKKPKMIISQAWLKKNFTKIRERWRKDGIILWRFEIKSSFLDIEAHIYPYLKESINITFGA